MWITPLNEHLRQRKKEFHVFYSGFLTDQCAGMNYTLITENLIVGSQPQKPEDIDHLKKEENVAYILNLQQDKDVEYWGIDLQSIIKRCQELGIRHMRRPVSKIFLQHYFLNDNRYK